MRYFRLDLPGMTAASASDGNSMMMIAMGLIECRL
jgi:hypothetical protein